MSAADEFLTSWTLGRGDTSPLTHADAEAMAERWQAEALENGIDPGALAQAAGGTLTDYLLRTFGEATDQHPGSDL